MNYPKIGKEIGELVEMKETQYGSSFSKSGNFLELLYPNGIKPEQYKDIAGYSLLGVGEGEKCHSK